MPRSASVHGLNKKTFKSYIDLNPTSNINGESDAKNDEVSHLLILLFYINSFTIHMLGMDFIGRIRSDG